MIATVTNFNNLSRGLPPVSRRFVLRRNMIATIYVGIVALVASWIRRRIMGGLAATSAESLSIWSMSGVATVGFVVLVFGGGTL